MAKISMKDMKAELTSEEIQEINSLDNRSISYDDDAPELTLEQITQFKRMDRGCRN
jgi:hypothetical protein